MASSHGMSVLSFRWLGCLLKQRFQIWMPSKRLWPESDQTRILAIGERNLAPTQLQPSYPASYCALCHQPCSTSQLLALCVYLCRGLFGHCDGNPNLLCAISCGNEGLEEMVDSLLDGEMQYALGMQCLVSCPSLSTLSLSLFFFLCDQ